MERGYRSDESGRHGHGPRGGRHRLADVRLQRAEGTSGRSAAKNPIEMAAERTLPPCAQPALSPKLTFMALTTNPTKTRRTPPGRSGGPPRATPSPRPPSCDASGSSETRKQVPRANHDDMERARDVECRTLAVGSLSSQFPLVAISGRRITPPGASRITIVSSKMPRRAPRERKSPSPAPADPPRRIRRPDPEPAPEVTPADDPSPRADADATADAGDADPSAPADADADASPERFARASA